MIKVSSAPGEPFSINIEYKKCNIIIVGVPLDDSYESDLKLFKDNKDISDKVGEYEINGEGLKKMLDTIDNL